MTTDELKRTFREATASPPPFARERVWTGLSTSSRPAPRAAWWKGAVLLAASALVGVLVTRSVLQRDEAGQWAEGKSAAVWAAARVHREGQQLVLERGELAVSSWGAPLSVRAGSHEIVVERGVAVVRVAGESGPHPERPGTRHLGAAAAADRCHRRHQAQDKGPEGICAGIARPRPDPAGRR